MILIALRTVTIILVVFTVVALAQAESCPCLGGVDNYCSYGPSYPDCAMTFPGGYCDPNGDGNFSDADWVRGYHEYQNNCSGGGGENLPDVVIEDLWWTPADPSPGENVQFHVRVRNGGTASTGADVGVGYFVDGRFVGWGIRGAMGAGQTSSDFGMHQRWAATSGSHQISAMVDDINRFRESNEDNNSRAEMLTVGSGSMTGGQPRGAFGSGGQTDAVTEPETWRWSEWFYGHVGIDRIAWRYDACGGWHNYAMGWHGGDLIEYRMKFGGDYSKLVVRGIADRPGPVNLAIYVDGQYKATVAWNHNNDCNQDVTAVIAGIAYGTHAIAIQFTNDHYNPGTGADRNFYLDGLRVERRSTGGGNYDLVNYLIPGNQNIRVKYHLYKYRWLNASKTSYRLVSEHEETFAYRQAGVTASGLNHRFFVKNDSGTNWEEFGFDTQFVYRFRDSSWSEICEDNGRSAFYGVYTVVNGARREFARWTKRYMRVGESFYSPDVSEVAAFDRQTCQSCYSRFAGTLTQKIKLVAHKTSHTTHTDTPHSGMTFNDVIVLANPDYVNNPDFDKFFYAKGYGLVAFEGPIGANDIPGDRWEYGGFMIGGAYRVDQASQPPPRVGLCE